MKRAYGVILLAALATTARAELIMNASFDGGGYSQGALAGQSGWSTLSGSGTGPTINSDGKLELNGTDNLYTQHSFEELSTGTMIYIGFSVLASEVTGNVGATKILSVNFTGDSSLSVYAATDASGNLKISLASGEITVNKGDQARFVLTINTTTRLNTRSATLAATASVSGTVPTDIQSTLSGLPPRNVFANAVSVYSNSSINLTLDDIMVSKNIQDDVYAPLHAPEPATALLAMPAALYMLARKRR